MSQLVEYLSDGDEPVTLAEVKANSRIDFPDDDVFIADVLIPAARQAAEVRSGASIRRARWVQRLPAFPKLGRAIPITHTLVFQVESVTYLPQGTTAGDAASRASLTLGTDVEVTRIENEILVVPTAADWPSAGQSLRAVEITYTAGLTQSDMAVRYPSVRHWILLAIAWAYEHRELFVAQGFTALPDGYATTLLDPIAVRPRF